MQKKTTIVAMKINTVYGSTNQAPANRLYYIMSILVYFVQ